MTMMSTVKAGTELGAVRVNIVHIVVLLVAFSLPAQKCYQGTKNIRAESELLRLTV